MQIPNLETADGKIMSQSIPMTCYIAKQVSVDGNPSPVPTTQPLQLPFCIASVDARHYPSVVFALVAMAAG